MPLDVDDLRRRPIRQPDQPSAGLEDEENDSSYEACDCDTITSLHENSASGKQSLYPGTEEPLSELRATSDHVSKVKAEVINQHKTKNSTRHDDKVKAAAHPPERGSTSESRSVFFWILSCLVVLLPMLSFYCGIWPFSGRSSHIHPSDIVRSLKNDFVAQPNISMKIINKSLSRVILAKGVPEQPAVIILASETDSRPVAHCIAKRLVASLGNSRVEIDGEDYSNVDPSEAKKQIDSSISNKFSKNKLNVGIVYNLDRIPGSAALIFHSYCDDQNAQFKKSVYLMTVTVEDSIPMNIKSKQVDEIVFKQLQKAWNSVHYDQLQPLLTRLVISAVPVLPDDLPAYC